MIVGQHSADYSNAENLRCWRPLAPVQRSMTVRPHKVHDARCSRKTPPIRDPSSPLTSSAYTTPTTPPTSSTGSSSLPPAPPPRATWSCETFHKLNLTLYSAHSHAPRAPSCGEVRSKQLGGVREPINPEAWNWDNENVGRRACDVREEVGECRGREGMRLGNTHARGPGMTGCGLCMCLGETGNCEPDGARDINVDLPRSMGADTASFEVDLPRKSIQEPALPLIPPIEHANQCCVVGTGWVLESESESEIVYSHWYGRTSVGRVRGAKRTKV